MSRHPLPRTGRCRQRVAAMIIGVTLAGLAPTGRAPIGPALTGQSPIGLALIGRALISQAWAQSPGTGRWSRCSASR